MNSSKYRYLALALSLFAALAHGQDGQLTQQLSQAGYDFDRQLAEQLLPQFEQQANDSGTEAAGLAYAKAALLVAELRRGDYEHQAMDKKARRQLGRDIDAAANAGLAALATLPDSSERYRLEADLLGTMIRSKFKGMKYQPLLEQALEKSLALDENNVNALVSSARRPLFAPPNQGGDLALALNYLNRALEIEPDHVQALLFRGTALAKSGYSDLAEQDWARAVQLNPNTAGARDRLMAIEMDLGARDAATDNNKET